MIKNNFTFNIENTSIPECPVCLTGVNVETQEQLNNIINTGFFDILINRLYWFIIFALLINLYIYYNTLGHYLDYGKGAKILFITQLFLQMGIYIYITYLKFLIFYNYWNLAFFFILLLPFFYILNIYSYPITEKYIEQILERIKKK